MIDLPYWSIEHTSGFSLTLGVVAFFVGAAMF
jgi:hypothetical protein